MNLCDVLHAAGETAPPPGKAAEAALAAATHVTEDSRRVRRGSLFVAVPGAKGDGHAFAQAAKDAGAIAIVGEREGVTELEGLPYVQVRHARRTAGLCAHALAGNPAHGMTVVGVTGTNGKTSTAALIDAIFRAAGLRTALLGTLGYVVDGKLHEANHTTPFGEDLANIFAEARDAGVTHVSMEASSHALEQHRVAGIPFAAAAFTNLTQDHLDYHGTMEAYRDAKAILFRGLHPVTGLAVVNADDPAGDFYRNAAPCRSVTYGANGNCRAVNVQATMNHTTFSLETPWGTHPVKLRLLGHYNVANALCAAAIGGGLGIALDTVVAALESQPCVPGRFEPVTSGESFQVVVDYAHTDDGLRSALDAARRLCGGRIITVFGCGGDRDKTKRPKMGNVAGRLSDYCILTSDNPRTEDPFRILLDAEVGLQQAGKKKGADYDVIEDRATAIRTGISMARPGDLVMIAGKGHEDYQIIGTEKTHFDDREVARLVLSELRR